MARAPRRPPEIPAKQWKGYSPSYKNRMARFYAKHPGATRQEARGKKVAEHVTRKEREQEKVRAYADRQAYRGGKDPKALYEKIWRIRQEKGMQAISRMIARTDELHAEYVSRGQPNSSSPDYMDYDLMDDEAFYDLDEDERRYR